MKIIHILLGKADPNKLNGVNKVVHNLATEQFNSGNDVEVWGITHTPDTVTHAHQYPLLLFPASKNRFRICSEMKKAIQKLPQNTVVHLHSVFLPELFALGIQFKKSSIRYVITPHGGYSYYSRKKNRVVKLLYMFLFEKSLLSNAYKLHALGYSEVEDLAVLAPLNKVILIPNGQNIEEISYNPVKTKEPYEKPVFGFCGRLSKDQKGLDLLIEGFTIYKRSGGKGEVWLIGDGPDKLFLKKLAMKRAIEKSIIFLGALFNDEKLSHIARMDVFVHTSRWDGIPMSVLEAAALSKPLLLSKATNLCDYVNKYHNGITLNENTSEEIAKAMHQFNKIMDNKEIDEIGQNSFRLVRDELNWHIINKKIISDLYQ